MSSDEILKGIGEGIAAYCRAEHDFRFDPAKPLVRLHEPTFGADEIRIATEVLLSTQVTAGKRVRTLEADFKGYLGSRHGVTVNSGSSANLLALAALANPDTADGLRPGDEVIVPALSWSTTVWPLVQMGLVPVIVDIDPKTFNIDPEAAARAVGPRTRAVMVVHVYGNPCDMVALEDLCREHGLILIEDCCEALGARFAGTPVGRFGRVGTFSFYFSHHITTLEGGIVVSEDGDLAETMRILRAHGWIRETEHPERWTARHPAINERFLFVNLGYNLRLTEVQAAMGSVQLPKLDGFVTRRRRNAAAYRAALAPLSGFVDFQHETEGGYHSWFGFTIRLKPSAAFETSELMAFLARQGVENRPIICGNVARQPAMARFPHRVAGRLDQSDQVMARAFSVGCHQAVDGPAVDWVVGRIAAFFRDKGLI